MGPRRYQIVVAGELSHRFAPAFDGMTVRCTGGQTAITGMVVDQSQLHGLLDRLESSDWSWSASMPSGMRIRQPVWNLAEVAAPARRPRRGGFDV